MWKDYKYAMGNLRIRTKTVSFGAVSTGMHRVERIACANAGNEVLRIGAVKGFLPEFIRLSTEPEVLEPGQEGYLILELDGGKIPGAKGKKQFNVLLDGISARPSDRTIKINVEIK